MDYSDGARSKPFELCYMSLCQAENLFVENKVQTFLNNIFVFLPQTSSRTGATVLQRLYPATPILNLVSRNSTALEIEWTVEGSTSGFILQV